MDIYESENEDDDTHVFTLGEIKLLGTRKSRRSKYGKIISFWIYIWRIIWLINNKFRKRKQKLKNVQSDLIT